jgi:hypothetical protein
MTVKELLCTVRDLAAFFCHATHCSPALRCSTLACTLTALSLLERMPARLVKAARLVKDL